MKASLLRRMILAQGLALGLLWLLSVAANLLIAYWTGAGMFDDSMRLASAALTTLLPDAKDLEAFREQARRIETLDETHTKIGYMKAGEHKGTYQILDDHDRLLFRSASAPQEPLTTAAPGFHTVVRSGASWRVLVAEDRQKRLRVLVAEPLALRQRLIWRSLVYSPIPILVLFVVVSLFTWLAARRALRPLRRLADAVEARIPGDLAPLEGHADLSETRPLVSALNRLFGKVGELLETQRRFMTDAAHELRTPLAVIAAQAHVLRRAKDDSQRGFAEEELQQGVKRAAQVVRQLLAAARLEAAERPVIKGPLDLAALTRDRLKAFLPHALAKGQDLGYEGPEELPWEADASLLSTAVDNLLDNAIRYTPHGGYITLRLLDRGGAAALEVEDSGPGVPAEFREAVLERFVRLPNAQEPGSGLGLAIVRRAVELHGGDIRLMDVPGRSGLRAVVLLPRLVRPVAEGSSATPNVP